MSAPAANTGVLAIKHVVVAGAWLIGLEYTDWIHGSSPMTHPGTAARAGRWRSLIAALVGALCVMAHAHAEAPVVVSSIRPLGLMVEALAGADVQGRVLRSSGTSPHEFVLRPSEQKLLTSASLVVWMGPTLERPLAALLARDAVPGIALLEAGQTDPHIWLDPANAADMAGRISAMLVTRGLLAPEVAERRLAAFRDVLRLRGSATAVALAPLREVPFLSLHDGYRPFVARYELRQVAALPADHERQPGARSLLALRAAARDSGARCLLHERGDNRALAENLVRDLGLHAVEVDPLARHADTFDAFLARFASDVQRCLAAPPQPPGDRP